MRSVHEVRAATRTESIGVGSEPLLERSEQLAALKSELDAVAASGRGRLVLVAGEAGIGKSALVSAFCDELNIDVLSWRLRGPAHAPTAWPARRYRRPDRREVGGSAGCRCRLRRPGRGARGRASRGRPSVVVLEDLHWADDATLDVVRLLGRRCEPARTASSGPTATTSSSARIRCGSSSVSFRVADATRISLAPLSAAGDRQSRRTARTRSRRACMRARPATRSTSRRCSPPAARRCPTAFATPCWRARRGFPIGPACCSTRSPIAPQRAELWLLEALTAGELDELESCIDVRACCDRARRRRVPSRDRSGRGRETCCLRTARSRFTAVHWPR